MDQVQAAWVRSAVSEHPAARKSFVDPLVMGLVVLPVLAGAIGFVGWLVLTTGDGGQFPLVLFGVSGLLALWGTISLIVGAYRLLSAVQVHLRIGQYGDIR
ncbi:hypothetical protein [Salana multivorans]|nr:hypothetical protein [Salana multivorans]